ncbi:MAG: HEAT repeat domain-containing protein [Deltaproteobacteria bacterium]|nr:HEAT repeat domain-containing protein [Deltaproteobacteria bacterium]
MQDKTKADVRREQIARQRKAGSSQPDATRKVSAPRSPQGEERTTVDRQPAKPADKPRDKTIDDYKDEELAQQVAEVQAVFQSLEKSIKTIGIYRHNVAAYGEYLERTYKAFVQVLGKYESVSLKVEQLGFKYQNTWVYQQDATDQNIAHKFYRDGIRILIFRRGLDEKELLDFVLICLTNFRTAEFLHDDMVSLMWKKEFPNIEYVVVESFAVGAESEEEARIEVDKIVNYLYKRLTSRSKDHVHFARISLEDLDIELNDVEQAKGVVIKGQPATAEQKSRVRNELDDEAESRMMPKLVVILFKVLEEELDQDLGLAVGEVFIQLLDSMLMHEDFRGINQILRKFKGMLRKKLPPANVPIIEGIESHFVSRMGESERIERVGGILDSTPEIKEPQEVYRYLTRLGENSLSVMMQVLENMERLEARRLFCDAMVVLGKAHLDFFVRRLTSPKANLVRDMVYVIDKVNPPDRLKLISQLLNHPNLAIRLEALQTLGSGTDDACRAYVMKALNDQEQQMRIMAARLLTNFDLSMAAKTLLSIVQHPDFIKKDVREMSAIYAALVNTNSREALDYFREALRSSSLLSKKKLVDQKRAIVNGLAMSGSITAFKFLKTELEVGIKEEDVASAAERACNSLREKLLGT